MKQKHVALILILVMLLAACSTSNNAKTIEAGTSEAAEAGATEGTANSGEKIVLKASHSVAPTHPYHLGLEKFAEIVSEKTNGQVQIDIFHSAQLGNERDNIEGLQMGTLDIAVSSTGPMGTFIKDYQVLDLPFLFETYEDADAALDGEAGQILIQKLEDIGVIGGAFWENGFREITTSEKWGPIESIDQLKGLKIRTQENEVHLEAFKALGADPTPMAWSEVFTSLQSGVLDAQENPVPIIYNNKVYEAQKNLSITNHFYSPSMILFSKISLDKLDEETQKILLDASKEAAIYERQLNRDQEKEQITELEKLGMTVVTPDVKPFKDAVQSVYDKFSPQFDAKLVELLIK